jgi:hypothetical protein
MYKPIMCSLRLENEVNLEMASRSMMFIPNFMKICQFKRYWRHTDLLGEMGR